MITSKDIEQVYKDYCSYMDDMNRHSYSYRKSGYKLLYADEDHKEAFKQAIVKFENERAFGEFKIKQCYL